MEYSKIVEVYEYLENTPSRLKKVEKIANFLRETDSDLLPKVTLLIEGRVFPPYSEKEIGIAEKMMIKIISSATGFSENEVMKYFKETGDLGLTAENLAKKKKQMTLAFKALTVEDVFENLRKVAYIEGKKSQDIKMNLVKQLLIHAKPKEAKYIVRTVLGELRIGVAEGVIRDAIAEAFFHTDDKEKMKEIVNIVEWAWFLRADYGEIAKIAKEKGLNGLKNVKLEPGKPFYPLLAEKAPDLKSALEAFEHVGIEVKYDGMRTQIHKKGDKIWLYTRRLENVTDAFPDLIELAKKQLKADECIVEGETLAVDVKTGLPLPFQILSQRIHRKYRIDELMKTVPIQINLFDIVYLNGEMLFDKPLKERRKILESIVKVIPQKFQLSEQIITKDLKIAEEFYKKALEHKQEGVMVKNLDAKYQPGRRVAGGWLKVKPIMETLDLVIIGAEWGTGKRANWMGSFILGCRDPETDEFLECGMLGTGIKEKKTSSGDITFEDLTEMLKPYIISEEGKKVKLRPKVVVEVAYEEIQKSPNYTSGFALRFPRLIRIRFDKGPHEADDIERLKRLYEQQK